MGRRRNPIADDVIELAFLGVGLFVLYELVTVKTVTDPATGQSVGPLNSAMDWLFPIPNPGGGETVGTGETYTGAFEQSVLHPINTFRSIVGLNQTGTPVPPSGPAGGAGGSW